MNLYDRDKNVFKHSPADRLKCLFIQPQFSASNYWNYVPTAKLIDAHTPAPPLGLLTVAAILPQHWEFKLIDLNVRPVEEAEFEWADLICVGGMLPQQTGILDVIEDAQSRGKFVVVGGADPSSQPHLYSHADTLIVGEAENTIPMWISSWNSGEPRGTFKAKERPDITSSPVPRYDLIDYKNYVYLGVQFSRGCPFNCEFCDIIELYGRKPRTKEFAQFFAELDCIYEMGYRGWIDIVDDNFIGNKRMIKRMLPELEAWCHEKKFPFFFSTEASMNMADDVKLMQQMKDVDFRYVFMGIETPDPELLLQTQKSQNTVRPIVERVQRVYEYGMSVSAGYIIGFDGEKKGMDEAILRCVNDSGTIMAMVGLLVALPNTQLTRRLQKEGRLISPDETVFDGSKGQYSVSTKNTASEAADQTAGGLNFITTRDRIEIFEEYLNIIERAYDPKQYFDRILFTCKKLRPRRRHWAKGWEMRRNLKGLYRTALALGFKKPTARYYWRNFVYCMFMGLQKFEFAQTMATMFVHFEKQSINLESMIKNRIKVAERPRAIPLEVS
jgi:radical SAM superfamily enzyme YgiQ (UPF0313 family)